jgi:hypothetical protein
MRHDPLVPADPWDVRVFRRHRGDDPTESCPAEEFLIDCPRSVAEDLFAIVDAVAASPPPQFPGGGLWEAMHGEMAGFYEARTRDQTGVSTACSASSSARHRGSAARRSS